MTPISRELASYCERLASQTTSRSDLQLLLATAKDLARHEQVDPKLDRAVVSIGLRIRTIENTAGLPMARLTPLSEDRSHFGSHPFTDALEEDFSSEDARREFVSFARSYLQELLRWRPDLYDYRVVDLDNCVTMIFSSRILSASLVARGRGQATLTLASADTTRLLNAEEIASRPTMLKAVSDLLDNHS